MEPREKYATTSFHDGEGETTPENAKMNVLDDIMKDHANFDDLDGSLEDPHSAPNNEKHGEIRSRNTGDRQNRGKSQYSSYHSSSRYPSSLTPRLGDEKKLRSASATDSPKPKEISREVKLETTSPSKDTEAKGTTSSATAFTAPDNKGRVIIEQLRDQPTPFV
jgi:hypothetical protein